MLPRQIKRGGRHTIKKFNEGYDVEDIRDTMGQTGKVRDSVYFFYGGEDLGRQDYDTK